MPAQRGQLAAGREVLFCSALGFHERENARDDCRPEGEYARGYLACCGDDGCDTGSRSTPPRSLPPLCPALQLRWTGMTIRGVLDLR